MIKIAVLGYGTVGSGVVEVLDKNCEIISKRVGEEIKVSHVLDLRDFPGDKVSEILVHDFEDILNDNEVRIVAEAMGGIEPAYTFAKKSIESGKHFCTSNKELVAKHGAELIEMAKAKNVNFMFEASVGGGIPVLRGIISSLRQENIEEITGILNGTTNYMMTRMDNEGIDFDDVLKDAQNKGYAERNPEADVEGYDACRKIAILSSLAFGKQVNYEDIHTEGITKISTLDMAYAKKMNRTVKLLGTSKKVGDKVSAMVAPFLVDAASPLYAVNDVFNAVLVKGNMLGDTMFYGAGAGKLPTASAVVADVIDIACNLDRNIPIIWDKDKLGLTEYENIVNDYFVRVSDEDGKAADKVYGAFDEVEVVDEPLDKEYAFIVRQMSEGDFNKLLAKIDNVLNVIRIK
ncbi:MAG: homoserine dehydrogenase [Lachnospiraceae bacterium]|nr:homoserine dehydrogenase [Lachnospiraceae bacterium]